MRVLVCERRLNDTPVILARNVLTRFAVPRACCSVLCRVRACVWMCVCFFSLWKGCAADRGFVRHRRGRYLARGRQGQADGQGAEHRHPELWRARRGEGLCCSQARGSVHKYIHAVEVSHHACKFLVVRVFWETYRPHSSAISVVFHICVVEFFAVGHLYVVGLNQLGQNGKTRGSSVWPRFDVSLKTRHRKQNSKTSEKTLRNSTHLPFGAWVFGASDVSLVGEKPDVLRPGIVGMRGSMVHIV